jgi:hypothetical protein
MCLAMVATDTEPMLERIVKRDRIVAAEAGALASYVQRGTPLERNEVAEIESIVQSLSEQGREGNDRLAELAVAWVRRNPQPLPLEKPSYGR